MSEIIRPIEVISEEINFYKSRAGEAIYEIGKRLIEAKEQLQHGEWLEFLKEKVDFSEASAHRFMRIANEYQNSSTVTNLGVSKALLLLTLPPEEREDFASQKHDVNGDEKTVEEMSKRELEKVIKERDEALKNNEDLSFEITDLEETIRDLREELDEIKNMPADVAEPGEEFVDKIRSEEQEKLSSKIEQLEKKLAKAKEQKEKAENAEKEAKDKLAESEKVKNDEVEKILEEKKMLQDQIEVLNKQLKISSSNKLTEFKLYFNSTKDYFNKMLDIISGMDRESEERDKLLNMLKKLIELITETMDDM